MYASTFAIDFVPVDGSGRTAPVTLASLLYPEPAERFPGFGPPVLAPVDGIIVAVHDAEPDHAAFRGLPSIRYSLTQARRAAAGWLALAGNHLMIKTYSGPVVALCHVQHHSVRLRPGQRVDAGHVLAGCGNTGNSTEPHLHVQAISSADVMSASALPITFPGGLPRNGTIVDAR
ncbi:MAG: M23 family metallopeptidase [Micrococcaceae bacterium]|nr:M23 family metallopeptidase [Micrococcaceae bacterium]